MRVNRVQELQQRFDAAAAKWDADPARVARSQAVVKAVRAAVPLRPDMRVLDVGAGTGLVALGLLAEVAEVTAADVSADMLRVLSEKARAQGIEGLHTRQADIAEADWPAASFDLVVSAMTLHHLPDVPRVLRRLRPALRENGWIALADLDTEDGSFHRDATGVYHRGFAREEICGWLSDAGFLAPRACDLCRMTRPGADGGSREYPIFLATAHVSAS